MKKHLLLFLAAFLPMIAGADNSGTCGDNITWTYVEATHTLTISGEGSMLGMLDYSSARFVPWRSFRSDITKVIIEDGVTNIGKYAFNNCSGLTTIAIPNSVTSIGDYAFEDCSSLTSITIPNSVTSIGDYAFFNCGGLTSITIPNSVSSIGEGAFYGTAWYDNQPDGLVYAGKIAYSYKGTMPDNTKIVLEEGTLGIADYAFSWQWSLTSITIPNSVTFIGVKAFYNCSGLTSITIPNSVTSIENSTFYGCSSLTSVTIPNSVTSIGGFAFAGCSGLTSLTIGIGLEFIGVAAFQDCDDLTTFYINDLASWCMVSFESTQNTSNPFGYWTIEHFYIDGEEATNLVIPDGVTRINLRAFYNLKSITSVTIPNSVTNIGSEAFYGCDNLLTVNSEITEPFCCGSSCFSENTLRKGTLYVPAGTKDLYTRFDGWREFLKIEEVGGALEESVWLILKDSQGASKLKLKKGVEQELVITPEEGWKLLTVTMDGTDVTAQLKNGNSFTTPSIMQDAVITIVYEQEVPSEVAGARQSKANVKVVDDGVIITNAEPDTRCVVYQSNGQQVTSVIVDGGSRKITLQKGQVYILTLGDRTLKFAL